MIGAILGDIIGSKFEFSKLRYNKSEEFKLFPDGIHFTDDTAMTIATADAILNNKDFAKTYQAWGNKYPDLSYGCNFRSWLSSEDPKPYNSYGNGSAMRVSPVGWLYNDLKTVFEKAEESALVTHNHDDGIKGAVSIACCIYLGRNKTPKKIIKEFIETYFEYDLSRTIEQIRPTYDFNETCQGSVPESIICFLESNSYEDAIRKAISLGGDTDTQACITGSIAEAYYGLNDLKLNCDIYGKLVRYLPDDMIEIIKQFEQSLNQ
jgi:ADP-ribosylglycohydrolase